MSEKMSDRDKLILNAKVFWGGFYRCPNTGRILEGMRGDDKVLCNCGHSNSKVPQERTEQTGTHIVRLLMPVSAEEYVDDRLARSVTFKKAEKGGSSNG